MGAEASKDQQQQGCCPPNSLGFKPEDPSYVPKGKMIKCGSVDVYSVGEGSRCIIMIHDIFGLYSGMNKKVCDTFAESMKDTRVVAPDFYQGNYMNGSDPEPDLKGLSLMFSLMWSSITGRIREFVSEHPWSKVKVLFDEVTAQLCQEGCSKFGLMGICWGAYVGFKACNDAKDKDKIKFNGSFHPSVQNTAELFGEDDMPLVQGVKCPQFIVSTPMEPPSWKVGGAVQKTLVLMDDIGPRCIMYDTNQTHGFITRGDTGNVETFKEISLRLDQFAAFAETNFA